ncbi:MAG: hypothetical protein JO189_18835, partial [Deltaproteobacteria bacterium]|nr:hypothetical protein [Deltaproteobacteria bacterium]
HHYSSSGNREKAVKYLNLAGQQAIQRSAYAEAIAHLTNALEMLRTLPDTAQRAQQELTLLIALGASLGPTKGFAAPELESVYTRARQLCQQAGETPQLFSVLWGLWAFYTVRSESCEAAYGLSQQLLKMAQRVHDPDLLIVAHDALGNDLFGLGEFSRAREHSEQSLALSDRRHHGSLAFLMGGEELEVVCRLRLAASLWCLGYPAQTLQIMDEALTLAQALKSPFNMAFAHGYAAIHHQWRGERNLARERAEAAITLAVDHGFLFLLGSGYVLRGWALVKQGRVEEGINQIREGMGRLAAIGIDMHRPYHLALLAEVHGIAGQIQEGLTALDDALDLVNKTAVRYYEAELHRIRGELVLTQNDLNAGQAKSCFQRAIEIARSQRAKSWELRATVSMARLLGKQGRHDEACAMLSDIYGRFTEGFDTADLKEAKALLDELSA